ncbi:MAG: hypothetical protein KAW17_06805 [Candidatus Eisenbacteria sp.]|nr:hypothetical protein [Candidatus Eisenbacteria bacterium]
MTKVTPFLIGLCLLGLAGDIGAEAVFMAEPNTMIRPRPGLRLSPVSVAQWGDVYDRVKTVGRWSRITFTDTTDAFVWSAWLATYDVVREEPLAGNRRIICFTVDRYLGEPTLEAMCRHILDARRGEFPRLKELSIEGYLANQYPNGDYMCKGRWISGGDSDLEIHEIPEVSSLDVEIFDRLGELYHSKSRQGVPIFDCDSLWIEAGQEMDMAPAEVRFTYDRVRWSRAKPPETLAPQETPLPLLSH